MSLVRKVSFQGKTITQKSLKKLRCFERSGEIYLRVQLRAGWSGDWIPVKARFSAPVSDRPWGPPSLPYNGYRVFPGGKEWPGRDHDPSPTSSAVGHERVELYLYSHFNCICAFTF